MHIIKREVRFGNRADKYDSGFEGKFLRKFYWLFIQNINIPSNSKVLDVACGTGELLKQMYNRFNILGYGMDIDDRMINVAKEKCPQMDIRQAKCDKIPFSNQSFDIITVCMAFHHFENRKEFINEVVRVIKDGGQIYIVELRLPEIIRKIANTIMYHLNIVGHFFTPNEISSEFEKVGIQADGCVKEGLVQIIRLKQT
ncbi:class I SAM-dependent methyltransferase [Desulfitobacterium sp. Sab5]|uniref:class I SAM-dependent methyltransferase n=1 Tax=Desulfitobacterium nosdiversum TaxID=3375356 RepID=UPI003CF61FDF